MTKLTKKMEEALNTQVNAEFWAAYLYLSMSTQFQANGLCGIAHWFFKQFEEEQVHAKRIMDYLNERGSRVILKPIAKVPTQWKTPLAAFEETLKLEVAVTKMIYDISTLAKTEKDYTTDNFLLWFFEEQMDEESAASTIIDALKLIGTSGSGLYMFDQRLLKRQE